MNKRTVICISERPGFPNQIKIGTTYIIDITTIWSDCDGTWYVDTFTTDGVRIGAMDITHFREV